MEHRVLYRDNQELQAADFINQQDWAQKALDHIVDDAINSEMAYAGFTMSKVAQTQIQTSPGRLYNAGAVYARDENVVMDLFNDLPVTTKRQFAIVCWGQTVQEDIQPRDFVIDADTGQAEPQSVAMEETRYCNVNYVRGIESADPQPPSIDANVLLIGYVTCDPTGIISFTQNLDTQIDNLALVAGAVNALNSWRSIITGIIDTLRTDLANLAKQLLNYTLLSDFQKLVDLVNLIYKRVFQPGVYIYYGTDNYLDTTQSAVGTTLDGAYAAIINEGLHFPGGGSGWTGSLQLSNPTEPTIQAFDTFILPKPSGSRIRLDCSFPDFPWIEDRILTHTYWTFTVRQLFWSRKRHRCGPHYLPCLNTVVWWYQAQLDPTIRILSFDSDTPWEVKQWAEVQEHIEDSVDWPRHSFDRWRFFWRDEVDLPYWSKIHTDFSHSGNHVVQTFLNSQDGWLSGLTVFSHKANFFQPLTLVVSGCDDQGVPDHDGHGLRRVILDATSIQPCYGTPILAGDILAEKVVVVSTGAFRTTQTVYQKIPLYVSPVRINFPPVFLRAGQRIAIHLHSTSDHSFSICDRDDALQVHQGHMWHSDGSRLVMIVTLGVPKSLRFLAHFCTWGRWGDQPSPAGGLRYDINLQPLQLAGGIGSVDVLAEAIVPPATELSYGVQPTGSGVWTQFGADPDTPSFPGNVALYQFRATFVGTTDLMPGLSLTNSQVKLVGGMLPDFHHISTMITVGTPTNNIKVILKLHAFDAGHETVTPYIKPSGVGRVSFGSQVTETLDNGDIMNTYTFTVSSVTNFQIEIDGHTDGTTTPFVVAQRIVYAT